MAVGTVLKIYDPTKINIVWNGRQLRMFGESVFTLARDEDNVELIKGVQGDSTYVENANKAGTLTIVLSQESPDLNYIEQCAEKRVMGNLAITDSNESGMMRIWKNCRIQKLPDRVREKSAPDFEVVFLIPDITI